MGDGACVVPPPDGGDIPASPPRCRMSSGGASLPRGRGTHGGQAVPGALIAVISAAVTWVR